MIGMAVQLTTAADFFEDFTAAPPAGTWRTHGDASLFQWNPTGHLEVTWDSSRTNSYFYHPLGTILGKDDDFTLAFDLKLNSAVPGFTEGKPDTFELAIGFINLTNATHTNFFRGKGTGTVRNIFELDYFPNNGLGATLWPAVWSTNASLSYRDSSDYTLIELPLNASLHVVMIYTAADRTLRTTMTSNQQPFGPINALVLSPFFTDFRVDAFAICSYSDHATSGSLHAVGEIDNVQLTLPPAPVVAFAIKRNGAGLELSFLSRTNWFYRAETTTRFDGWQSSGSEVPGTGGVINLPADSTAPAAFWQIHATRP